MINSLNIGIIGLGLIGEKRIKAISKNKNSNIISVCDTDLKKCKYIANKYKCEFQTNWKEILKNKKIDTLVISVPNYLILPISKKAIQNKKNVLIEKPMGKNLKEAEVIYKLAKKSNKIFKVGFNHRYYPSIMLAYKKFLNGEIGEIINIRAVYGHGGRPGYQNEWRGDKSKSGGGELTDQGVHVLDLVNLFCGVPKYVSCFTQTAVWPLNKIEDNAFCNLIYKDVHVQLHTSWTQWKNKFSFEIFGKKGSLVIDGIGGNYGREKLVSYKRNIKGGKPYKNTKYFNSKNITWIKEWDDFLQAIKKKKSVFFADEMDGLKVMKLVNALYLSKDKKKIIKI
tara:strand:- start:203 stop:1219 length:1017 start_codon:yes stop_codon:yes gene_type:complete